MEIKKFWLWISLAMFLIPELLWSPIVNLVFSLLQNSNNVEVFRTNFLMNSENNSILLFVLALQFIGLIGALIFTLKAKFNLWIKSIVIFLLSILVIIVGLLFYIGFSMRNGIGF